MQQTQKPSIGRIVHYIGISPMDLDRKMHCAAIVTEIEDDGTLALEVFYPGLGSVPYGSIAEDATATKPGTWHWPERVE